MANEPAKASVSGRMANVMARRVPAVNKWFSRRQAAQYEKSGGAKGATLMGKPVFRLVVVGRKSGEPRPVMLMLVRDGADLLVCGSQAGTPEPPNWWRNLTAAGGGTVQVGDETYDVDAREVTDPAERTRTWALLTAAYPDFATYQKLTTRQLPIGVLRRRG